jgi:hypothetical protein
MGSSDVPTVRDLLAIGTDDAHVELRRRHVLRSGARNPTGDVAEWLVAQQLGVSLAPPGQLGYDLVAPDGSRVQIKGRRVHGAGRGPAVFGTIVNLDGQEFDWIACVLLDLDWSVKEAWAVPHEAVSRVGHWSERHHQWRIPVAGSWRRDHAVRSLDLSLAEAAADHRPETVSSMPTAAPTAPKRPEAVTSDAQVAAFGSTSCDERERIRALVHAASDGERSARDELQLLGVLDGAAAHPAGEYARHLVAAHYGGRRTQGRGHGHEVVLSGGERLQVRGRHRKAHRDPKFFALDFDPGAGTSAVIAVLFETDFTVSCAWRVPWLHIERLAYHYRDHAWRLAVHGQWRRDVAVEGVDLQ